MKKSTAITLLIVIVLVIVGIIVFGGTKNNEDDGSSSDNASSTASASVTENKKSGKFSVYKNSELGFQVDYPNEWEADTLNTGVSFIMPIDQTQVSTVAKLQADLNVSGGTCAFPPVTTVKDRGTLKVGGDTLNMISMSNTVQGRVYFNRMYSLQKDDVCYVFSFASIALSPSSKNLTGSNLTQAQNNNKAIVDTADVAFTDMVKSFRFVSGPAGEDETKVVPVK